MVLELTTTPPKIKWKVTIVTKKRCNSKRIRGVQRSVRLLSTTRWVLNLHRFALVLTITLNALVKLLLRIKPFTFKEASWFSKFMQLTNGKNVIQTISSSKSHMILMKRSLHNLDSYKCLLSVEICVSKPCSREQRNPSICVLINGFFNLRCWFH